MASRHLRLLGYLPVLALPSFATPSSAAEPVVVEAPPGIEAAGSEFSSRVDFAWGVALTSNYVSDGETQSGDRPALQAYGEISSGIVYSGIWLSTVKLEPDTAEFDLYWGLRPRFGPLSLDFNYTRYVYDQTGDCCGEWIAKVEVEVNDTLTFNGEFDYDPQSRDRSATIGLTLALADTLDFSSEIERDLVSGDNDWNAGLKWQATDTLSFDLRYYDSDQFSDRFVVTLAYDFSTAE